MGARRSCSSGLCWPSRSSPVRCWVGSPSLLRPSRPPLPGPLSPPGAREGAVTASPPGAREDAVETSPLPRARADAVESSPAPDARAGAVEASALARVVSALEDEETAAAEAALAPLLRDHPADRGVKTVAGMVRFHQGRYAEAVALLQEGGLPTGPMDYLRLARGAVEVTKDHVRVEGEHFVVSHRRGKDEVLVPYLLDALERQRRGAGGGLRASSPRARCGWRCSTARATWRASRRSPRRRSRPPAPSPSASSTSSCWCRPGRSCAATTGSTRPPTSTRTTW